MAMKALRTTSWEGGPFSNSRKPFSHAVCRWKNSAMEVKWQKPQSIAQSDPARISSSRWRILPGWRLSGIAAKAWRSRSRAAVASKGGSGVIHTLYQP